MDTVKPPDRYEMRAFELEEGQLRRYDALEPAEQQDFYLRKHEAEVLTIIEIFRKASKTYQEG